MSARPPHADGAAQPPPPAGPPPVNPLRMLLVLDALLMAFSIVFWLLGDPTLVAAAGTGAIALTIDVARRLLAVPSHSPDGRSAAAPGGPPTITSVGSAADRPTQWAPERGEARPEPVDDGAV